MTVTFIIGTVICAISFALSILAFLGVIFKNVGSTSFGIFPTIFFSATPCLLFAAEMAIYHYAAHVWGIAYFFIALNLYFLFIQYLIAVGSAVFTKNKIYVLNKFLLLSRYSYDNVIGYTMKKEAGYVLRKFSGKRKVVTFNVEVYFSNNRYAHFSVKDETNKKIVFLKRILEEHKCSKNGRIKNKSII